MKINTNTALLLIGGVAAVAAGVMFFQNMQAQQLINGTPATDDQGVSQVPGGIQVIDGTWIEPLPNTPDPYQGYQDYRNGERMAY